MNDRNLIDRCQDHCLCNMLQTSNSLARRNDAGVVIDCESHPNCTCKISFLFATLAVRAPTACPALHADKTINTITY